MEISVWKKLSLTLVAIAVLASAFFLSPATAQAANGPYFDKVSFLVIKSPDAQVAAMKLGEIDMYPGLIRPGDVEELSGAGMEILYTPGGHFCYLTFNLRNYTIDDPPYWGAGWPAEYGKRFLMDPWFRKAVTHLVPKDVLIGNIFKYIVVRVDSVVPPQLAKYHNRNVPKYTFDPPLAVQTLEDHGYEKVGGVWRYVEDGQPLADITFLSPSYEEAPTSYTIVKTTVEEMHEIGLTNVDHVGMAFDTMLAEHVYPQTFDCYFLCWSGIGPDPDHLWAFFHSINDVYQGRNHPGLHDDYIDELAEIVHTSLDDDPPEVDGDPAEVTDAAMEMQMLLMDPNQPYGLCYIPIYSRNYFDAYQPGLEGMVNMPLAGSDNGWTFINSRWQAGEGHGDAKTNELVYVLGTELRSLSPLTANSADEVEVWSMVFDGLMDTNPYTLEDIPGMAEYRELGEYTGDPDGAGPITYVDGMRFYYRLRSGLTWSDGHPFDTSDIKFALDYVEANEPGLWTQVWEEYVGTKIINATAVEIYYNMTSLWLKDIINGITCFLPEHIWSTVPDYRYFYLWQEDHTATIPNHPDKYMKKLMGTGPWCFYEYSEERMEAVLYPNPNYWKSKATVESELADYFYWYGDINTDTVSDVSDLVEVGVAWGAIDGVDARYQQYKDIVRDSVIDIEDARVCGYSFAKKKWY